MSSSSGMYVEKNPPNAEKWSGPTSIVLAINEEQSNSETFYRIVTIV